MNVAFIKVFLDVRFKGKVFSRCEVVNITFLHEGIQFEVDSMVPRLVLWEMLRIFFIKDRVVSMKLGGNLVNGGVCRMFCGEIYRVCGLCVKMNRMGFGIFV